MNIDNLHFFDNNGYNLNFEKSEDGYWEGTIYLPKVSVGLYANTTIYVLEEIQNSDTNTFFFPQASKPNDKITFTWDKINTFVDEFFMFNFDESYILKETSALIYTPNDGPDCNTLIINKFDEYNVTLDNKSSSKALPIHIAFSANEKHDATTYNRTLVMTYNKKTIARITFFAETVEEDERLKIWNANLGYNITPEDEMIFYKSDIKEYMPDYQLLNEKRKELMMEGSNIYPYIGSYKAIINAIKFFGYDNLNIIEYWRNINPDDENFGKIYHSSKYSLTKKETLTIGAKTVVLPNKDYRKINSLALVYSINKPTGETDDWELPKVQEQFTYTIEEAIIKLFALRKKLNKEFMPGTSRIIDIIGEANYFTLHALTKFHDESYIKVWEHNSRLDFEVLPNMYPHITDNEYFNRYITFKNNIKNDEEIQLRDQMISDISNTDLSSILNERPYRNENNDIIPETLESLTNKEKCEWYKNYYQEVFVDYTVNKAINDNDDYPYDNPEYDYTDPYSRFTAKVVLSNTSFSDATFGESELKFNCVNNQYVFNANDDSSESDESEELTLYGRDPLGLYDDNPPVLTVEGIDVTFGTIDRLHRPDRISWKVTMSKDQVDEDLKKIGVLKEYKYHNLDELEPVGTNFKKFTKTNEYVNGDYNYNKFFVELPYIGYYDVTMELGYYDESTNSVINVQRKTKKKCIKVEPYQIELIGFYYDARELPKKLKYENEEGSILYNFIQENINKMHALATSERTVPNYTPKEYSMPTYGTDGVINSGPYYTDNFDDEWYLADNVSVDMAELLPLVKYTRYIRNGVDVKPYTWFILGYEYSKITGKVNPRWTITNQTTGITKTYEGRYFTLLLKKEGNYTITLKLEDKNGNEYEVSRNIIVVSKSANYKIYQTFKKDYDYMTEQKMLKELNEFFTYKIEDPVQ